ncbi:GNAT family protein [Paenibacillus sp. Marseille-Q4541]|uniref:GNAT family N-acetyltransferase n=1 Tax=Paenibacillus sp. Marseille-Q4541 TaxID=2831522 RepID=UPI001BA9BAF3|nr:GNAT family protein [Paenibacillus sp. Marseille-Q4541]
MNLIRFLSMTEAYARDIATWTYPEPYQFYSMGDDEETIHELMDGSYHAALDEQGELIGFICTGEAARVPGGYAAGIYNNDQQIDIGLGMRPDLTGNGLGASFLVEGLHFIWNNKNQKNVQLVVATFNERAIKVYERVGFQKGRTFLSRDREFIVMNKVYK